MEYFTKTFKNETNPSKKGTASELTACLWLLSNGYDVFKNICPSGKTDIIAVKGNERIFIDVKSVTIQNGKIAIPRRAQTLANSIGTKILYVFEDGSCKFDYEVDKYFGKKKIGEVKVGGYNKNDKTPQIPS